MKLISDLDGNVSFGGTMLRLADGTIPPTNCSACGKPLKATDRELCPACSGGASAKPAKKPKRKAGR